MFKKHDVAGVFLQLLDSLANAGSLGDDFSLAELVKQELELGTRRGLVIDDHRFQHLSLLPHTLSSIVSLL